MMMSEDKEEESGKQGWSSARWGARRVSEKGLEGEMSGRRGEIAEKALCRRLARASIHEWA